MTFILSKVLWEVLRPSTLLLLLALVGAALLWTRWRRGGRVMTALALVLLALPALLPLSAVLERPLENYFPQPELPAQISGVIVLGGAEKPATSVARGQVTLNDAGERLLLGLGLAQRYPAAKLVFSGGTSALYGSGPTSAAVAAQLFGAFGVAPERLILETEARNTVENADLTKALVDPQPGETWVLVTSAMHMPRSVGLFQAAGWRVLPYPVDYQSSGRVAFAPSLRFAEELDRFDAAVREWLGLVSYRLLGRTETLLPER